MSREEAVQHMITNEALVGHLITLFNAPLYMSYAGHR